MKGSASQPLVDFSTKEGDQNMNVASHTVAKPRTACNECPARLGQGTPNNQQFSALAGSGSELGTTANGSANPDCVIPLRFSFATFFAKNVGPGRTISP